MTEFLPIYLCIGFAIFLVAIAIIVVIRHPAKTRFSAEDPDFLEEMIAHKKRTLNANVGAISFRQYCIVLGFSPVILGFLGWIFLDKSFAIIFASAGLFVPELLLRISTIKQKKKFEERYARALRALSSDLRSGLSIIQAVQDISQNSFINESIRDGFKQIHADIQMGQSIRDAFMRFAKDSKSDDAMDLAAAISLQTDIGGQEAQIVYTIAQNIYDRIMMKKEIDTIFMDTSVMINVMDVMPFALLLSIYMASPDYLAVFFESPWTTLFFIAALGFTCIGTVVIRRMAARGKGGY